MQAPSICPRRPNQVGEFDLENCMPELLARRHWRCDLANHATLDSGDSGGTAPRGPRKSALMRSWSAAGNIIGRTSCRGRAARC